MEGETGRKNEKEGREGGGMDKGSKVYLIFSTKTGNLFKSLTK